ncbi:MAG TPA: GtrA family protein [Desulfobacteria bacterium]|nr:GtrA family protein [Desulfobacteria bacterium]
MKITVGVSARKYLDEFIYKEDKLYSFLRFGVIGVVNTIHYYIWYLLLLRLTIPYVISHITAFTISMVGSFFLNCFFTFKTKPTFQKFIKYPLTTLSNFVISTLSLILLVNILHLDSRIAALLASILPIPITFIMTHRVLKHPDAVETGQVSDRKKKNQSNYC